MDGYTSVRVRTLPNEQPPGYLGADKKVKRKIGAFFGGPINDIQLLDPSVCLEHNKVMILACLSIFLK